MNNEFSFEITEESKNAINELLKQQGLRHFKLYTDFYGELDVVNYEEYQKLEKEIERLNNIIDETIKTLDSIFMLDNVTITNNAVEKIYKSIDILKGGSNEK